MGICCANQASKNNEQKVIALNEKETQELCKENDSVQEDKKEGEEICWTHYNSSLPVMNITEEESYGRHIIEFNVLNNNIYILFTLSPNVTSSEETKYVIKYTVSSGVQIFRF